MTNQEITSENLKPEIGDKVRVVGFFSSQLKSGIYEGPSPHMSLDAQAHVRCPVTSALFTIPYKDLRPGMTEEDEGDEEPTPM